MSDQDFFFDEDEAPKKGASKAAPAKKSAPRASAAAAAPVAEAAQGVSMPIAGLMAVIALLAGLIVGILLPIGNAPTTALPTATGTQAPAAANGQQAPQLSEEQLSSGQLPAGHPKIGGSSDASGSKETSGK